MTTPFRGPRQRGSFFLQPPDHFHRALDCAESDKFSTISARREGRCPSQASASESVEKCPDCSDAEWSDKSCMVACEDCRLTTGACNHGLSGGESNLQLRKRIRAGRSGVDIQDNWRSRRQ